MKMTLQQVGELLGYARPLPAVEVTGWSVDTRTLRPGELFFALRGTRLDGHDFVGEALSKGASGVVVEREVGTDRAIVVADTLVALQQLAARARQRWGGTVVGVTGSVGKTTTKEAIACVLEAQGPVGKSEGNYNNHVGLPLSLLRVPDEARVAVLELGMNHAGEIRHLASIARPEIGVVTAVGYAHIENFGSLEGIAAAKRELIEALPETGVAVLNWDDPRVASFRQVHRGRSITFGFSAGADIRADGYQLCPDGARFHVAGHGWVETRLAGRFAVRNLLAAIAVGTLFGVPFSEAAGRLRELAPVGMRGDRIHWRGATLINDCYNSNPDAVRAMLELLAELPAKRRIAVLGEMRELGQWTETLHREVGRWVAASPVDLLLGVAGAARWIVEEAVRCGMTEDRCRFFDEPVPAGEYLRHELRAGDVVMLKASRAVKLEQALEVLLRES